MSITSSNSKFNIKYDGVDIIIYHVNKGEGLPKHLHEYAHLIICLSGSIAVRKENAERIMDKNTKPLDLKAAEWHEIEALEDGTVFVNVFAEGKT